jgi:hypothetical protein
MSRFVVLLRDDPSGFASLSPEEMQAVIEKYIAWSERLRSSGRLVLGEKLVDGAGRVTRGAVGAPVVSDGPYAESREIVGGLYIINAASYAEAEALLADCPHLMFGSIEIREIQDLGDAQS